MSTVNDPRIFIHLGYGKTGTTTLQRSFFGPLHRKGLIYYLGMFPPEDSPPHVPRFFDLLTEAIYLNRADFSAALPTLRQLLTKVIERAPDGLPIVLSNEHFLLSQYSTKRAGVTVAIDETAARLARVFQLYVPTFVVGVRRQDQLLYSMFVEHASRPNHANKPFYSDLAQYVSWCLQPDHLFHSMYDFHASISSYKRSFPVGNFMIYPFEAFVEDQRSVVYEFASGLSLPHDVVSSLVPLPMLNVKNKSNRGVTVEEWSFVHRLLDANPLSRPAAHWFKSTGLGKQINKVAKKSVLIRKLTNKESESIVEMFSGSNRQLLEESGSKRLALQLAEYGYISPKEPARQEGVG